jgi:hypothetical protein
LLSRQGSAMRSPLVRLDGQSSFRSPIARGNLSAPRSPILRVTSSFVSGGGMRSPTLRSTPSGEFARQRPVLGAGQHPILNPESAQRTPPSAHGAMACLDRSPRPSQNAEGNLQTGQTSSGSQKPEEAEKGGRGASPLLQRGRSGDRRGYLTAEKVTLR